VITLKLANPAFAREGEIEAIITVLARFAACISIGLNYLLEL